ncbi:hypothetical protein [Yinghuangia sp. YIM S09857]|uniref:hypothetical protein n=1 Tax=Yinghuangia sp. YIM S09857 TaxID=3436929 RepID=UPI003F535EBE
MDITPEQAASALDDADRARRRVADEVGLPRAYWWVMAAAWVLLGVLGSVGPRWLAGMATVVVGSAHAIAASRLLGGRHGTGGLRVSRAVAGPRVPLVVVGMLVALVAVTVLAALVLDADGTEHASIWAAVLVAAVVGFGGPEILRVLRRWARA